MGRDYFRNGIRKICLDIHRNLCFNKGLHLPDGREKIMSKEIMDDYDAGYADGVPSHHDWQVKSKWIKIEDKVPPEGVNLLYFF